MMMLYPLVEKLSSETYIVRTTAAYALEGVFVCAVVRASSGPYLRGEVLREVQVKAILVGQIPVLSVSSVGTKSPAPYFLC